MYVFLNVWQLIIWEYYRHLFNYSDESALDHSCSDQVWAWRPQKNDWLLVLSSGRHWGLFVKIVISFDNRSPRTFDGAICNVCNEISVAIINRSGDRPTLFGPMFNNNSFCSSSWDSKVDRIYFSDLKVWSTENKRFCNWVKDFMKVKKQIKPSSSIKCL